MADIQTVDYGEPHWNDKVNRNFAALNADAEKANGVVAGLQWTSQTRDGLVFANGVECNAGGYSYTQVGNCKLVLLSISVKITADFKGIAFPDLVTLPDAIASGSPYTEWGGGDTESHLGGNKVALGDTVGNANRQWQGESKNITFLYIV